jgi:hypothetical protein
MRVVLSQLTALGEELRALMLKALELSAKCIKAVSS